MCGILGQIKKELFLARNNSGMKLLYYLQDDANFIFPLKIQDIDIKNGINFNAKILFLFLGYIPDPYTIYRNIEMFPVGFYGYFKDGKIEITNYNDYKYESKIHKPYNRDSRR